jgi:hypothetical protein
MSQPIPIVQENNIQTPPSASFDEIDARFARIDAPKKERDLTQPRQKVEWEELNRLDIESPDRMPTGEEIDSVNSMYGYHNTIHSIYKEKYRHPNAQRQTEVPDYKSQHNLEEKNIKAINDTCGRLQNAILHLCNELNKFQDTIEPIIRSNEMGIKMILNHLKISPPEPPPEPPPDKWEDLLSDDILPADQANIA